MKCGFNLSLCAQQLLKPRYNVFSPLSPASTGLLKPHRYHLSTKATPIATMSQEQPQEPAPKQEEEQKLPPLSPQDFRAYNQKAEQMEYFVSHPASLYISIPFENEGWF
jgi:hypothetical protein